MLMMMMLLFLSQDPLPSLGTKNLHVSCKDLVRKKLFDCLRSSCYKSGSKSCSLRTVLFFLYFITVIFV